MNYILININLFSLMTVNAVNFEYICCRSNENEMLL